MVQRRTSSLSVKGLIQEFCGLRGLPVPSAIVGAADKSTLQHFSVLKAVIRKLLEYSWPQQTAQAGWTSIAGSVQGDLATLMTNSDQGAFHSLVEGSLWNLSQKVPITGPVTDQQWAARTALALVGPPYLCYMGGGFLYISPDLEAGESLYGIYRTNYGILSDTAPSKAILTDNDTFLFPDDVVIKGFEALWKKQKGEPYVDDWNDFIALIAKRKTDYGMPDFDLGVSPSEGFKPGIFIPVGSWPV